jgi:hypothetical protein
MELAIRACAVFGTWALVHYVTPRLYIYWCVPATIVGFLMSPFAAAMPHCIALRWALVTSADTIKTMFVLLGTWVVSHLVINNTYAQAVAT